MKIREYVALAPFPHRDARFLNSFDVVGTIHENGHISIPPSYTLFIGKPMQRKRTRQMPSISWSTILQRLRCNYARHSDEKLQNTPMKNSKTLRYDGALSYYRDRFKLECDFVIHLPDGRYGLFECKCGDGFIEEGATHLNKLEKLIRKHRSENLNAHMEMPSCKVILTDGDLAFRRPDGVFVIPLSCLKP